MFQNYLPKSFSLIVSGLALILVNAIPLLGVLFRDWDAGTILFLYWAESIPVGIFALLRIGFAGQGMKPKSQFKTRLGIMLFFPLHFGIFMTGHLFFVFAFFGPPALGMQETVLLVTSLFLSHGTSFGMNYLIGGEYRVATPDAEMARPYTRIFVMHITLVVGGIMAMFLGEPILLLVVMVLLKTGIDLYSHLANHARYRTNARRPIASDIEQPGNLLAN